MLTLLIALQAATGEGPTLWQNVKAGMTLADLKVARPAARPIAEAEKGKWPKGCEIADDRIAVEGVTLEVCYETQAGRVTAVLLHSLLVDHGGAADRLKPALAGKYGAPIMDVCGGFDRVFGHQSCNTVWKTGAVTIKADRIKVAGRHIVRMEYRADPAKDASGL